MPQKGLFLVGQAAVCRYHLSYGRRFRDKLDEVAHGIEKDEEVIALRPLFDLQNNCRTCRRAMSF